MKIHNFVENTHSDLYQQFKLCYLDFFSLNDSSFEINEDTTDNNSFKFCVQQIEKNYLSLEKILNANNLSLPELILFQGPGIHDGHALLINGKAYTFLDITLVANHYLNPHFEQVTHLCHEICHGIHYSLNPSIVPSKSRKITSSLLAEGVAVWLTKYLLGDQPDRHWFGIINSKLKKKWISNCEFHYIENLKKIIQEDDSLEFKNQLLFHDSSNAAGCRMAYWQIEKAIEAFIDKPDLKTILAMTSQEFLKHCEDFLGDA